jgi:hypothetical protein
MGSSRTGSVWTGNDHFQPDESIDPQAQRRLRGQLERIDYTAYAANREVIGQALGAADAGMFQHLALMAAHARAGWIKAALEVSEPGGIPTAQQVERISHLRIAYVELTEAYDAMRRLVERGYVAYADRKSIT